VASSFFYKPSDEVQSESAEDDAKLEVFNYILERVDEENLNAINDEGCTALYYGKY
jgi:hypothetical protein